MTYATVSDYLVWTSESSASSAEEALLEELLSAASTAVDEHCFRSFSSAASAASERTFAVRARSQALFVDDYIGTATVTIDGTEITTSAAPVSTGRPYTTLIGYFPDDAWNVQVSARWGWETTPQAVKTATIMLVAKLEGRRQTPSGVERGNDEIGFIRILATDADVRALLEPFRRKARAFA